MENATEVVVTVEDEKGRPAPHTMTERDLLIELVTHMRALADTVEELSATPMFAAMQNGGNPLAAMFGFGR